VAVPQDLSPALRKLLDRFRSGQRAGLARAISLVEDERPGFQAFLHEVMQTGPRTRRLGMTGPPGAGKSSLVAILCGQYREAGERLGVVAVDPTSPFSGGALLGDRIRMGEFATDPGIFIRSMATRGSLGGLATATKEVLDLMDAFGFDRVLAETVGVGQTELEITGATDTVVVVLVPESGDAIQAMKAGLMEIADVFVVNKADRPGADRLVRELRTSMQLRAGEALRNVPAHHGVDLSRVGKKGRAQDARDADEEGAAGARPAPHGEGPGDPRHPDEPPSEPWEIPILKTDAQSGEGVGELREAIEAHGAWLASSGELERRRRERARIRIRDTVERALRRRARDATEAEALGPELEAIVEGTETPYSVAARILEELLGAEG